MFKAWAASQKSENDNIDEGQSNVLVGENSDPAAHSTRHHSSRPTKPTAKLATTTMKRISPAQLRVNADLTELSDQEMVRVILTADPLQVTVVVKPTSGPYRNASIDFSVKFSEDYPHKPPKVRCLPSIYHPNIEPAGGVCLDILREAWTPIRGLSDIVVGLRHIILHPNATDPLNVDAAEDMIADYDRFVKNVRQTMKGSVLKDVEYTNILLAS